METKISQAAQQAAQAVSQRSNSGERLSAFLAHGRMMVSLYRADRQRAKPHGR